MLVLIEVVVIAEVVIAEVVIAEVVMDAAETEDTNFGGSGAAWPLGSLGRGSSGHG